MYVRVMSSRWVMVLALCMSGLGHAAGSAEYEVVGLPGAEGHAYWAADGKSLWIADESDPEVLLHFSAVGELRGKIRIKGAHLPSALCLGSRSVSPDGTTIVLQHTPIDDLLNATKSILSFVNVKLGTYLPGTPPMAVVGSAEWMADGRLLAKLSNGPVALIDMKTGETHAICGQVPGIERVRPTLDGKGVVLFTDHQVFVTKPDCTSLTELPTPRNLDGSAPHAVLDSPTRKNWLATVTVDRGAKMARLMGPNQREIAELNGFHPSDIGWWTDEVFVWMSGSMLWYGSVAKPTMPLPLIPSPDHWSKKGEPTKSGDSYQSFSPTGGAMVFERHNGNSYAVFLVRRR